MNLKTNRADLLRSVLEGVTMNLNIILKIFQKELTLDSLLVIGGGAQGRFWNQLMADIFGIRIEIPLYLEEATSMGAAINGGVGFGVFKIFDIVERFIDIELIVEPNPENREIYDRIKAVFEKAYIAMEPLKLFESDS